MDAALGGEDVGGDAAPLQLTPLGCGRAAAGRKRCLASVRVVASNFCLTALSSVVMPTMLGEILTSVSTAQRAGRTRGGWGRVSEGSESHTHVGPRRIHARHAQGPTPWRRRTRPRPGVDQKIESE